jgi:hypothetical protein
MSVRYVTSSLFSWGVTSSPSAVIRNSNFIVKNLMSWGTSGFLHAWSRTTMPSSEWFLVLSTWAHGLLKIMLQRHFIASDITKKRNKVIQMLNILNTQFFESKYKEEQWENTVTTNIINRYHMTFQGPVSTVVTTLCNLYTHCRTVFSPSDEKNAHLTERHCPVPPFKFNYLTICNNDQRLAG